MKYFEYVPRQFQLLSQLMPVIAYTRLMESFKFTIKVSRIKAFLKLIQSGRFLKCTKFETKNRLVAKFRGEKSTQMTKFQAFPTNFGKKSTFLSTRPDGPA